MQSTRTSKHAERRWNARGRVSSESGRLPLWRLNCPYCFWFLLGLVLMVSAPGLASAPTPIGAPWIWLMVLPVGSAVLKRILLV